MAMARLLTEAQAKVAEADVEAQRGKLSDYTTALDDAIRAEAGKKSAWADWQKENDVIAKKAKENDLIAAFKVFDTDNSGKLTFGELSAILQRRLPGRKPMSSADVRALIVAFDGSVEGSEKDGMLDVAEFVKALTADADLRRAVTADDQVQSNQYQRAVERYDKDQSGGLSVAELRPVLIASGESANEAREVVEQYDANGDGELSKDELAQAWERDGRKPIHIKDKSR